MTSKSEQKILLHLSYDNPFALPDDHLHNDEPAIVQIVEHAKDKVHWHPIEDLDTFFSKIYNYHQKHGFLCMMIEEILEALQFVFIICLSFFMIECINYSHIFNLNFDWIHIPNSTTISKLLTSFAQSKIINNHILFTHKNISDIYNSTNYYVKNDNNIAKYLKKISNYSKRNAPSLTAPQNIINNNNNNNNMSIDIYTPITLCAANYLTQQGPRNLFWVVCLSVASLFLAIRLARIVRHFFQYLRIRAFYNNVLKIRSRDLPYIPWQTVADRLKRVHRTTYRLSIHTANLSDSDILHRILRFQNYFTALVGYGESGAKDATVKASNLAVSSSQRPGDVSQLSLEERALLRAVRAPPKASNYTNTNDGNNTNFFENINDHNNINVDYDGAGDLLPLNIRLPLLGWEMYALNQGLIYNLELIFFRGPLSPFKTNWQLRDEYKKASFRTENAYRLRRRIRIFALLNFVLSPVIFMWQLLYYFFTYTQSIKNDPGQALGARIWSPYADLYFRHYNELDHELRIRLARAYPYANRFVASFGSRLAILTAKFGAFFSGSLIALALVLSALVAAQQFQISQHNRVHGPASNNHATNDVVVVVNNNDNETRDDGFKYYQQGGPVLSGDSASTLLTVITVLGIIYGACRSIAGPEDDPVESVILAQTGAGGFIQTATPLTAQFLPPVMSRRTLLGKILAHVHYLPANWFIHYHRRNDSKYDRLMENNKKRRRKRSGAKEGRFEKEDDLYPSDCLRSSHVTDSSTSNDESDECLVHEWDSERVRDIFCTRFFELKLTHFVMETLGPVINPWILWAKIAPRSQEIVDFFRTYTVELAGVGDVCSLAATVPDREHRSSAVSHRSAAQTERKEKNNPLQEPRKRLISEDLSSVDGSTLLEEAGIASSNYPDFPSLELPNHPNIPSGEDLIDSREIASIPMNHVKTRKNLDNLEDGNNHRRTDGRTKLAYSHKGDSVTGRNNVQSSHFTSNHFTSNQRYKNRRHKSFVFSHPHRHTCSRHNHSLTNQQTYKSCGIADINISTNHKNLGTTPSSSSKTPLLLAHELNLAEVSLDNDENDDVGGDSNVSEEGATCSCSCSTHVESPGDPNGRHFYKNYPDPFLPDQLGGTVADDTSQLNARDGTSSLMVSNQDLILSSSLAWASSYAHVPRGRYSPAIGKSQLSALNFIASHSKAAHLKKSFKRTKGDSNCTTTFESLVYQSLINSINAQQGQRPTQEHKNITGHESPKGRNKPHSRDNSKPFDPIADNNLTNSRPDTNSLIESLQTLSTMGGRYNLASSNILTSSALFQIAAKKDKRSHYHKMYRLQNIPDLDEQQSMMCSLPPLCASIIAPPSGLPSGSNNNLYKSKAINPFANVTNQTSLFGYPSAPDFDLSLTVLYLYQQFSKSTHLQNANYSQSLVASHHGSNLIRERKLTDIIEKDLIQSIKNKLPCSSGILRNLTNFSAQFKQPVNRRGYESIAGDDKNTANNFGSNSITTSPGLRHTPPNFANSSKIKRSKDTTRHKIIPLGRRNIKNFIQFDTSSSYHSSNLTITQPIKISPNSNQSKSITNFQLPQNIATSYDTFGSPPLPFQEAVTLHMDKNAKNYDKNAIKKQKLESNDENRPLLMSSFNPTA